MGERQLRLLHDVVRMVLLCKEVVFLCLEVVLEVGFPELNQQSRHQSRQGLVRPPVEMIAQSHQGTPALDQQSSVLEGRGVDAFPGVLVFGCRRTNRRLGQSLNRR